MLISFNGPLRTESGSINTLYVCEIVVEEYTNTQGSYSLEAACPEDFHGEQHLEFYIESATAADEYEHEIITLSQDEIADLYHMHYDTLYKRVWDKCVNAV